MDEVTANDDDPDTQAVISLLRGALATSGLSQASFARAVGTSGSRFSTYLMGRTRPSAHFCMRAQRLAQALAAASRQGLLTAPATARAVREQLQADDGPWAWRMLLQGRDHLRLMLAEQDGELLGSWQAAPSSTGSPEFDALLAALARHEFEAAHREAPDWTHSAPLDKAWIPEHPFLTPERAMAQAPAWLRELNIFVPERDLITA
jgi:transcriptional regulator with XRE-family HTH domain